MEARNLKSDRLQNIEDLTKNDKILQLFGQNDSQIKILQAMSLR